MVGSCGAGSGPSAVQCVQPMVGGATDAIGQDAYQGFHEGV